ncbi:Clavaminate synthase-like protein [Xylaria arbuscula]|nr:Clavaminate synthase-like protein [Xylaria arbuscula]
MKNWIDPQTQKQPVSFGGRLKEYAQTHVNYEIMIESEGGSSGCSRASLKQFKAWLDAGSEDRVLASFSTERSVAALSGLGVEGNEKEEQHSRFIQFVAPLSFILNASRYNSTQTDPSLRIKELYVAQSDIRSLPPALAEDLPIPEIVSSIGKADIYGSSIWLGLQPTYTPLHRDPNPNFFCQLIGSKTVRLMHHGAGLSVFQDVRRQLGRAGNSRFRGPGMMEGPERERLHHAVWVEPDTSRDIWEARLEPGDGLFIPTGWWHSVRSIGYDAELNASANWWFR